MDVHRWSCVVGVGLCAVVNVVLEGGSASALTVYIPGAVQQQEGAWMRAGQGGSGLKEQQLVWAEQGR